MQDHHAHRRPVAAPLLRLGAALVVMSLAGAAWAGGGQVFTASQKDQTFRPGELDIKRGDTVEVVNDDGDLLHHAYVSSDTFNFDSGDQEPGEKVDIKFPVAGTFNILCGIHPRMKLRVHVE